jgi:esterase/lipase superfamily enzyme
MVVTGLEDYEQEEYFRQLRMELEELNGDSSAFIFVHGFRVSFEAAAQRTAHLFVDLHIKALPVFYAWSSKGLWRST